jgi:hypothetical protein
MQWDYSSHIRGPFRSFPEGGGLGFQFNSLWGDIYARILIYKSGQNNWYYLNIFYKMYDFMFNFNSLITFNV